MKGILVDSNVILDVFLDDLKWADWSESKLEEYSNRTSLYINSIIYSEISMGFTLIEDLEWAIDKDYEFPENVILLQTRSEVIVEQKAPIDQVLDKMLNMFGT